jgi:hypothetical protein
MPDDSRNPVLTVGNSELSSVSDDEIAATNRRAPGLNGKQLGHPIGIERHRSGMYRSLFSRR